MQRLTLSQARRTALAAQGLDRPRPAGRVDARHLRRLIRQLGLLQIDYVNVLLPAQYQVPFSRLGPYDTGRLDDLVYRRREFTEQWAHEASIVPMESWPLLRHRRETYRARPWGFEKHLQEHSDYVGQVIDEIRRRGPVTADDLPPLDSAPERLSDGFGWANRFRRQVLEAHFGFGRLAVAERLRNFQRVYDLAERIVPPEHLKRRIPRREAQRLLLLQAARAHGVASAADLADYFRMPVSLARRRLSELLDSGELRQARVEGWRDPAFLHPKARTPRRIGAATLLSPFDPLIWYRPRVSRLFQFDYRIEIWVPRAQRQWGYYVLPFLLGDRLVARVDLKADRKNRLLLVPASYIEEEADPAEVAPALTSELQTWCAWLGLEEVEYQKRGNLSPALAAQKP